MPFDFLKRKKRPAGGGRPAAGRVRPAGSEPAARRRARIPFDGLTEEWRLAAGWTSRAPLRALNKREPSTIAEVQWAPLDGSEPLARRRGSRRSTRTT